MASIKTEQAIVLDCCAAVEMARQTDLGRYIAQTVAGASHVISSSLYPAEITNALRGIARAGLIDAGQAQEYTRIAINLIDEYTDTRECAAEALAEGIRLDHPTYDMFYFVLARRNACALVTADKRLAQLCGRNGVSCISFAEVDWE